MKDKESIKGIHFGRSKVQEGKTYFEAFGHYEERTFHVYDSNHRLHLVFKNLPHPSGFNMAYHEGEQINFDY